MTEKKCDGCRYLYRKGLTLTGWRWRCARFPRAVAPVRCLDYVNKGL